MPFVACFGFYVDKEDVVEVRPCSLQAGPNRKRAGILGVEVGAFHALVTELSYPTARDGGLTDTFTPCKESEHSGWNPFFNEPIDFFGLNAACLNQFHAAAPNLVTY